MDDVKKGFTLVELLVVVAVIAVLAIIFLVTFGGFMDDTKKTSACTNHKTIVTYAMTIVQKCGMTGSVEMMSKPSQQNGTVPNTSIQTIQCYGDKFFFWGDYFINDMDNRFGRMKNPFKVHGNRVQQPGWCTNTQGNPGFTWINSRTEFNYVTICTCCSEPCDDSANVRENTIYFD